VAGSEDKRGKRELRVLRLIEVVRSYCTEVRYVRNVPSSSKLSALNNALAAITKLSFEEEHRVAIGELGGVEAIGEFLELSFVNKDGDLSLGKLSIYSQNYKCEYNREQILCLSTNTALLITAKASC
jgi:adenomatosis polyposis coli protein